MRTCKGFLSICAGLLAAAALSGCGNSSTKETVPTTVTLFNAHSVIFTNNSTMTMGYNAFGQLGDGTLEKREAATLVGDLRRMTGGAVGGVHTLAFSNQTTMVWAWGYNAYGQLGNTTVSTSAGYAYSAKPVLVEFKEPHGRVTDVAAGGYHSLAVAGGSVFAWGYNVTGAVGDPSVTNPNYPVKLGTDRYGVPLPTTASHVAAGGLHSLALFDEGATASVYAWGSNSYGQLGFSHYSSYSTKPRKVDLSVATGKVEQIGAGGKFSLALDVKRRNNAFGNISSQTLWGWGYGGVGQLRKDPKDLSMLTAGKTDTAYSEAPLPIFSATGVQATTVVIKKFVAGLDHVLLLLGERDNDGSDGSWTVQAVGFNFYGQLGNNMGNGTSVSSFELVNVLNAGGTDILKGATDIAAFGHHSLALVNGKWYAWGNNNMGQLGSTASTSSATNPKIPVLVTGF